MKDIFLKDKIILVTGSSRGIGAACSELLLSEGANVIINYLKDKDSADKIIKKYDKAQSFQADLRSEEEINNLFKFVNSKYGRLDALVNNAGVMLPNMIATTNENDINHQIELNIKAPFYCLRKAARIMMRKQSGSIVNISSIMGRFGASGHTIYSATKGALLSMTLSARRFDNSLAFWSVVLMRCFFAAPLPPNLVSLIDLFHFCAKFVGFAVMLTEIVVLFGARLLLTVVGIGFATRAVLVACIKRLRVDWDFLTFIGNSSMKTG